MTSQIASKGLPPPPLRIDKRCNDHKQTQHGSSQQRPTTVAGASTSASGPSHLSIDESAKLSRTPSGRFRIRVPSLTKQAKSSEAPQSSASVQNTMIHPSHSQSQHGKAWQPRWAPKLKRTNPSESVTTYSPILDAPLPPLPTSIASPPPAVQLDDSGFGRPFSTSGLLDLNASRFSFLNMSNKDRDSDSDSQDSHATRTLVQHLPAIREPPATQHAQARPPLSTVSSATTAYVEAAMAFSSLQPEPSRGMLGLMPSTSSLATESSRSPRPSLVAASPALGTLISSFPSPLTHERPLHAAPSSYKRPAGTMEGNGALRAPAMQKENSWDGGERVPAGHASAEPPYLDMDDESDTELLQTTMVPPPNATVQPPPGPLAISPTRNRPVRNPPPRPAPNMALPALPPKAASSRQHTPSSSVQLDALQQANGPPSASSTRPAQRPLILPSLRSSSSIDRLAAMGSSSSSPLDEATLARTVNGSNLKLSTLPRSASTDELAKSLDIPRDTVKQMLDTAQHVWRNHLLGSSALLTDAPSSNDAGERLPRSSSSPMLSTMFASQGSSDRVITGEELSKGSVAKPPAGRGGNRASMLGLPYISSSRPSFEHQSPGWAVSKNSMDAPRPSAYDLQAERAKHRRTFLGRSSQDGPVASYNFSRPMRCDTADGSDAGMAASVSMPSLAAARAAPKPPALLQSPLLLKGESEATGFAQFVADDEQEILVDSSSEAHQPFVLAPAPLPNKSAQNDKTAESPFSTGRINVHKPMPELPRQISSSSPKLIRRNSDTVLNRFAPEFGKRAPGELHAWSVCIDADGVPAIRPSPSAFHRPNCPLAGKNNATWQCGCRSSISGDFVIATPTRPFAPGAPLLLTPGQSSPDGNRSLSASNAMDPIRQAQLWSQVERNKELIRKHQEEIAGLQEQVVRISTEMGSARPSFSSVLATPDLAPVTAFPVPPSRPNASGANTLARVVSPQLERPPVPAKQTTLEPFPVAKRSSSARSPASASTQAQPPQTLRGRIASLSKMSLAREDGSVCPPLTSDSGHSRLRSSSSSSSLNKVFRFPWSRSTDKVMAFPEPTPFTLGERNHRKATSTTSLRDKAVPRVRMYSVDESRPLPAPPVQDASVSSKDKRFPSSARKFSYDMLRGPSGAHSSVGSRHLRGRSGSSKSSSFGTSIFSSNEGHEPHETSRFASFPRLGRRWDSISSRGTNVSARNSAEVSTQPSGSSSVGSMPALSSVASSSGKPMPELPQSDFKLPPPRRSSLLRKSLEAPRRNPIPDEFLQANDTVMAPISEQSEIGSPASARQATVHADLKMSPASFVGASPAGPARMSMSERYKLQGLTVPAPLALSSSLTSPALGSFAEPGSGTKVGEGPRSPTSQRAKSPLPVTFSHGALTVARRPSVSSRS